MSEEDKETFSKAKPYIEGVVALAMLLRGHEIETAFDIAQGFVEYFEERNK